MSAGKLRFRLLNLLLAMVGAINLICAQSKKSPEASLRVTVVDPN